MTQSNNFVTYEYVFKIILFYIKNYAYTPYYVGYVDLFIGQFKFTWLHSD